jgi:hypothetical protein
MDRVAQYQSVQKEAIELFKKKNADYGDAFATYGPIGVIVRMGDKISRLNSVTKSGITMVNTESVRDTLIDLHNYAAMAVMLLDEDKLEAKCKAEPVEIPKIKKIKQEDDNISPTFQETQELLKNKNKDKI